MAGDKQSIGLLGGTFDPVHNGHLAIAKSFLASGFIDQLWILLTPDPPHKTEQTLTDYEDRLKMLRLAFQSEEKVKISDLEQQLPKPSYTVQTLRYLSKKYPDQKFYLCVGGDSIRDFKQWKNWEEILDYCELLVARRPSDNELSLDSNIVTKAHFVAHHPIEISSTAIRRQIGNGEDVANLVPRPVYAYIEKNNLYKKQ